MTAAPTRLELVPGRWIRLPGTGKDIMLHGKYSDRAGVTVIERDGRPDRLGGWNLARVHGQCYIRRAPVPAPEPVR